MGAVYRRVRVVRRGGVRELQIDGSFASLWRPGEVLTESVWDAMAAALLALPAERRRSVLLLGLGAGSTARILRAVAPSARIVGVEIDRQVVEAARSHFELDRLGVEVVVDDADAWLARARGRFDLIIDDVFVGRGRAVRKPAWLFRHGLPRAAARLAPGGVLVSNTLDETREVSALLGGLLPQKLRIGVRDFDNRVLLAGSLLPGARALREELRASPVLAPASEWLRFRTLRGRRR